MLGSKSLEYGEVHILLCTNFLYHSSFSTKVDNILVDFL
jgi:hypothetical protein